MMQRPMDAVGKAWGGEAMTMGRDADAREEIALKLTIGAMHEAQRATVGLLAVPASLALGLAATISYATAFVERGFQMFEQSLGRLARDASEGSRRELEPSAYGPMPPLEGGDKPAKNARS
jgi:hypothetical protein